MGTGSQVQQQGQEGLLTIHQGISQPVADLCLSLIYFGTLLVVEASPKVLGLGDSAASPFPKCWENVGTVTPT